MPARNRINYERRSKELGSNALILLFSVTSLLGFTALVIDVGYLRMAQAQIQAGVDAAALGGVEYLNLRDESQITAAQNGGVMIAGLNPYAGDTTAGDGLTLAAGTDVRAGFFDTSTDPPTFTAWVDGGITVQQVNAVRVTATVSDISAIFAGAAFGHTGGLTASAASTAVKGTGTGAGNADCFLPIAIPDCFFTETYAGSGQGGVSDLDIQFSSANEDNAGWAGFGGVNAEDTVLQINSLIDGTCTGEMAAVEDEIDLQNGVVTPAIVALDTAVESSSTTWDEDAIDKFGALPAQHTASSVTSYGNTFEGPIILFASPDDGSDCGSEEQFNQSREITGFAWAVIYDVLDDGNIKNIRMKLDFEYTGVIGDEGGGLETGVQWVTPGVIVP